MPLANFHSRLKEKPIIPAHMIMAMSQIINPGVPPKQTKISITKKEIGVFAMMKSIVTFQNVVSSKLYFQCFENDSKFDYRKVGICSRGYYSLLALFEVHFI